MSDSEQRYQRIFENTPIALWDSDFTEVYNALDELRAAGVTDFRRYFEEHPEAVPEMAARVTIQDINRRTVQTLGLPDKALVIGSTMDKVLYDRESVRVFKEQLIAIAAGHTSFEAEGRVVSPEGHTSYILFSVAMLEPGPDGRRRGLASSLDITARRHAELALSAANQELKRSNEELEQFAYVASHDLQEPLRVIASFTEVLQSRYGDQLDERASKYVERVVSSAQRMKALIDDLLHLSRLGTSAPPMSPVDCSRVVSEVLDGLDGAHAEHRVHITYDGLPTVMGNETRLGRLFQNLISNALKFRGDDPPRVHIQATRHDREWLFSVRDNGIGIPADKHDQVFAIFQRLHGRGEYTGTGIGLSIAKKIVEQHGGRIWLESELGVGTTFYFSLPAADPAPH